MLFKLLRLFFPLLILIFVLPLWLPGPDGEPIMNWRDWLPQTPLAEMLPEPVQQAVEDALPTVAPATEPGSFYRWQDERGRWHFSDSAPAQQGSLPQQQLPVIANRMDPLPVDESAPEPAPAAMTPAAGGFPFSPTTIPVQDIPKLIDDAKKLQNLADKRNEQLQAY